MLNENGDWLSIYSFNFFTKKVLQLLRKFETWVGWCPGSPPLCPSLSSFVFACSMLAKKHQPITREEQMIVPMALLEVKLLDLLHRAKKRPGG